MVGGNTAAAPIGMDRGKAGGEASYSEGIKDSHILVLRGQRTCQGNQTSQGSSRKILLLELLSIASCHFVLQSMS